MIVLAVSLRVRRVMIETCYYCSCFQLLEGEFIWTGRSGQLL